MRATVLAALGAAIVVLVFAQQVIRAQTGPLPLVSVFELHLSSVAIVLAIGGLVGSLGSGRAGAWVRLVALAVLLLAGLRVSNELLSTDPRPATGGTITALSWNLEMESKTASQTVAGIAAIDADLVALQELTPAYAAAIENDATLTGRYAYRILDPQEGPTGFGLLSRLPLVVSDAGPRPTIQQAGLLLPDGRTVELFNVHPRRPLYRTIGPIPIALDTRDRDEDLLAIEAALGTLSGTGPALVIGDLNATSSEPGMDPLEVSYADAHENAGTGPGFTWRPEAAEALGIGVLRIDHVMTGGWLRPIDTSTDCEATGDHCRLLVTLAIEPPGT